MGRVLGSTAVSGPPTDHYDVGYDEGGTFSVHRKVVGFLTETTFAMVRWLIQVATWIVQWAFGFGFADILRAPAARVAQTYQTQVVGRLGLASWVWLFTVTWCGWHALRGRLVRGLGELGVSFAVAVVAVALFAAPATLLLGEDGALVRTRELSLEVAALTVSRDGTPPPEGADTDALVAPLTASVHRAFVEIPHQLLNWGQVLDDGDPSASPPRAPSRPGCLATYRELVTNGPHGTSDDPRKAMERTGCKELADFNHNPGADRLMAAVVVLLAAVLVFVLMVLVAGTLAAVQVSLAGLVALAPFAFALGVAPGAGRQMLVRWSTAALRALTAVVLTALFLSLLLVTVDALLAATATQALIVQMGVVDLVVVCAFVARSRLLRAGRGAVEGAGRRIEQARVGGTHGRGWLGRSGPDAQAGLGATELWRENRRELGHATDRVLFMGAMARGPSRSRGARGPRPTRPGGDRSPAGLRTRLADNRGTRTAGHAAKLATGTAKLALASTVGAPVYLPRAARAARAASTARAAATQAKIDRARRNARRFGQEYATNVWAGVALPTKGLVAAQAASVAVGARAERIAVSATRAALAGRLRAEGAAEQLRARLAVGRPRRRP